MCPYSEIKFLATAANTRSVPLSRACLVFKRLLFGSLWCLTKIGSCSLSSPTVASLLVPDVFHRCQRRLMLIISVCAVRVSCLACLKPIIHYWTYRTSNDLLFAGDSSQDDRKCPILVFRAYRTRLQRISFHLLFS